VFKADLNTKTTQINNTLPYPYFGQNFGVLPFEVDPRCCLPTYRIPQAIVSGEIIFEVLRDYDLFDHDTST